MKSRRKNSEKSYYLKYILATLGLVLILAVSIVHSNYTEKKMTDISKAYLSKITSQNADIFSSQMRANLQTVDVIARIISNREYATLDEINDILRTGAKNSSYVSMGVVLVEGTIAFTPLPSDYTVPSGLAYGSGEAEQPDGRRLLTGADWKYINKTMSGFSGLSGGQSRIVNGKKVHIYAQQIYREHIIGTLVVFFNDDFFNNLILPETLDEKGCSYIADQHGDVVFASENFGKNELFDEAVSLLSAGWSLKGAAGDKIRRDVESGKADTVKYDSGGKGIFISYAPINFKDWYLVSLTETGIAEARSDSISDEILRSLIYILVVVLTIAIYYTYVKNQNFKRLERKMHVEAIQDESYRMIMEQTDDIIFEYDTVDKTYFHTTNFRKNFGYEPTRTGFLGSLESDYVHPEDVVRFAGLYEKMKKDRTLTEAEVRIINSEGEYLWTRIYMLGVFDRDGNLAKVIGKIVNIDEKKKEIQYLKEMAVTDSATGVYNKQTTEEMIKAYLNGEGKSGKHALLMIDIDNFKEINDDYGHRVGDSVLASMGNELNHIFRAADIKGRVGGDEFMVLMKDIEGEGIDFISDKAKSICQMFKNSQFSENNEFDFSASIGIAIYDMDGSTYEELYESADRALYNCKNSRKGTYAFCRESDVKFSSR